MTPVQKRRFYIGLVTVVTALFIGGIITGFAQRNDKLCRDGKPPVSQKDQGLGQIEYLCHDGQIAKK